MVGGPRRSLPALEGCGSPSERSSFGSGEEAVLKLAEQEGRLDVIDAFRSDFLTYCLVEQKQKPAQVWKALKTCVASYATVQNYEQKMDHGKFVGFLTTGIGSLSGTDKDGRPILWLRPQSKSYKFKTGSSEIYACLRAYVWLIEIARLKAGKAIELLYLIDDSKRNLLDFNIAFTRELIPLKSALTPFCYDKAIVFGASASFRTWWNIASELIGNDMRAFSFLDNKEDAANIVTNVRDIPEWWLHSKQEGPTNLTRNCVWEWERCLERGRMTTSAKEIYNPAEQWSAVEEQTILTSVTEDKNGLDPITESGDED
jgi:CRAL/TRIO domain